MAGFLDKMELTLYFMRLEDKYWGIFLLAVLVLFYFEKKETKGLLWFTIATGCLCLCPLTAYGITRVFPALESYYPLWHMVPTGVVVCGALTILKEEWCDSKWRTLLFMLGVSLLFFFGGEFAYTSEDVWNDDFSFLGKEQGQAYELMMKDAKKEGIEEVSFWGPYKVMADSRIYNASLFPIYGKDISVGGMEYNDSLVSMYQGYSNYETVGKPAENMKEQVEAIANSLNVYSDVPCEYVVLLKPSSKVEAWRGSVEQETEKTEETIQPVEVDPNLVKKIMKLDTVEIFQKLGYVYVGETESLQIFRRL